VGYLLLVISTIGIFYTIEFVLDDPYPGRRYELPPEKKIHLFSRGKSIFSRGKSIAGGGLTQEVSISRTISRGGYIML
jgi:hypothetical protein